MTDLHEFRAALVACERHNTHNAAVVQRYVERVRRLESEVAETRAILDEVLVYVAGLIG